LKISAEGPKMVVNQLKNQNPPQPMKKCSMHAS